MRILDLSQESKVLAEVTAADLELEYIYPQKMIRLNKYPNFRAVLFNDERRLLLMTEKKLIVLNVR